jgi:hypothetical protein
VTQRPDNGLITGIMALKNASLEDIKAKYAEVFGQESPSTSNKVFLWKRIAYRMQEQHYGKMPETTQDRIGELIDRYDPVNNKSLRPVAAVVPGKKQSKGRDRRLPIPGAILKKEYKGRVYEVKILEAGFEYEGKIYKTLSSIAKVITGAHWNGYLFFNP